MKVSVVTVAFNSARTLGYTIDSFLSQTHRDAELIVVDGASTDRTVAIAESYGDSRIRVYSEPDDGLYDAMNKGLLLYTGDAVGFLNSDDRYCSETVLARIAEALETADIVHGNVDFVRDHERSEIVRRWRGSAYPSGGFRRGWMPAHPTFYVRRQVAERTGAFDPSLTIAADYDFMLRAIEAAPVRSVFLDEVLVSMMAGGASTRSWRSYIRGNLESLRSRRKWLGAGLLDGALFAKPGRKIAQHFPSLATRAAVDGARPAEYCSPAGPTRSR